MDPHLTSTGPWAESHHSAPKGPEEKQEGGQACRVPCLIPYSKEQSRGY